jgi:hypothetical protein
MEATIMFSSMTAQLIALSVQATAHLLVPTPLLKEYGML